MQSNSISSTTWHLLCAFVLLWSGATAVQDPRAEKPLRKMKKLMRRERRQSANSPLPTSTNSFEVAAVQQPLVDKKGKKLMRRERRRSGTSSPVEFDGNSDASGKSDTDSHVKPGHLGDSRMHAAAAAAAAMSAPVGKAVANHTGKPVPPARFAERPSLPASMISAEQNTKSDVENDIVDDIVNDVVNDIVGTPTTQEVISAEHPKLARTSTAAAVPIAVEAVGPVERQMVSSVAVPASKSLSDAASASNAATQMPPSATMPAKRGAPQLHPTTQLKYIDAANKSTVALEASLSEDKLRTPHDLLTSMPRSGASDRHGIIATTTEPHGNAQHRGVNLHSHERAEFVHNVSFGGNFEGASLLHADTGQAPPAAPSDTAAPLPAPAAPLATAAVTLAATAAPLATQAATAAPAATLAPTATLAPGTDDATTVTSEGSGSLVVGFILVLVVAVVSVILWVANHRNTMRVRGTGTSTSGTAPTTILLKSDQAQEHDNNSQIWKSVKARHSARKFINNIGAEPLDQGSNESDDQVAWKLCKTLSEPAGHDTLRAGAYGHNRSTRSSRMPRDHLTQTSLVPVPQESHSSTSSTNYHKDSENRGGRQTWGHTKTEATGGKAPLRPSLSF